MKYVKPPPPASPQQHLPPRPSAWVGARPRLLSADDAASTSHSLTGASDCTGRRVAPQPWPLLSPAPGRPPLAHGPRHGAPQAFRPPPEAPLPTAPSTAAAAASTSVFTLDDATALLSKKLRGLQSALGGVDPTQRWDRSVLHVWAETHATADALERAAAMLPAELCCVDPEAVRGGSSSHTGSRFIIIVTVSPRATMHHIIFRNADAVAWELPDALAFDPDRHAREVRAAGRRRF
jgi:hypothetical protein